MAGLLPFTTVQTPQPIAGRFMFVDYGVAGEPWHERWIFEVLENRHAVIVTPDHEVYVEVMQVDKRCFRNMRMCAAGARALPTDLGDNKGQPGYRVKPATMPHSAVAKAPKRTTRHSKVSEETKALLARCEALDTLSRPEAADDSTDMIQALLEIGTVETCMSSI